MADTAHAPHALETLDTPDKLEAAEPTASPEAGTVVRAPLTIGGKRYTAQWYLPAGTALGFVQVQHGFSRHCPNLLDTTKVFMNEGLMAMCLDADMSGGNPKLAEALAAALVAGLTAPDGRAVPERIVVAGQIWTREEGEAQLALGADAIDRGPSEFHQHDGRGLVRIRRQLFAPRSQLPDGSKLDARIGKGGPERSDIAAVGGLPQRWKRICRAGSAHHTGSQFQKVSSRDVTHQILLLVPPAPALEGILEAGKHFIN